MAETLGIIDSKRASIKRLLALGIPALLLSACATNAEDRAEASSPAERYSYDYLLSGREDDGATWCLEDSPYDEDKAVITHLGEDGVLVTPTDSSVQPLKFAGLSDVDNPLQPADEYTEEILASYGCDTSEDGDRNVKHF